MRRERNKIKLYILFVIHFKCLFNQFQIKIIINKKKNKNIKLQLIK